MAKRKSVFGDSGGKSDYVIDFATGRKLRDTPEEDVRQKVERFLVEHKGYEKSDILVEEKVSVVIGRKRLEPESDLIICIETRPFMIIECKSPAEPLRPFKKQALSYARLLEPPALYTVLTKWSSTEVYDTFTSDVVLGNDIFDIPSKTEGVARLAEIGPRTIPENILEEARSVLFTFQDPKEIANVFDQCHNIMRMQAGLDARGRLYEMCKVLVAKLYEERAKTNRFTARNIKEAETRFHIDARGFMNTIFGDAKRELEGLFDESEEILLGSHVLRQIVRKLENYSLFETGEDILGLAFEVFLRKTMTGRELGEFFTPREIVDFMIQLVDPKIGDKIIDPACGSGGFLITCFYHILDKIRADISEEKQDEYEKRLIEEDLWGIDIDAYLLKICRINLKIHGDGYRHLYRADALDIFGESKPENKTVNELIGGMVDRHGGVDIVLTNPPFGSGPNKDITDEAILKKYAMGKDNDTVKNRQVPQILFLELCLNLLKPNGRMAIVLPDGILSNPADKNYTSVRRLIQRRSNVEAVVGLPQGTFNPYGSGVKPCILLVRKHPQEVN